MQGRQLQVKRTTIVVEQKPVPLQCKAWSCYESSCWWLKKMTKNASKWNQTPLHTRPTMGSSYVFCAVCCRCWCWLYRQPTLWESERATRGLTDLVVTTSLSSKRLMLTCNQITVWSETFTLYVLYSPCVPSCKLVQLIYYSVYNNSCTCILNIRMYIVIICMMSTKKILLNFKPQNSISGLTCRPYFCQNKANWTVATWRTVWFPNYSMEPD